MTRVSNALTALTLLYAMPYSSALFSSNFSSELAASVFSVTAQYDDASCKKAPSIIQYTTSNSLSAPPFASTSPTKCAKANGGFYVQSDVNVTDLVADVFMRMGCKSSFLVSCNSADTCIAFLADGKCHPIGIFFAKTEINVTAVSKISFQDEGCSSPNDAVRKVVVARDTNKLDGTQQWYAPEHLSNVDAVFDASGAVSGLSSLEAPSKCKQIGATGGDKSASINNNKPSGSKASAATKPMWNVALVGVVSMVGLLCVQV